MMGGGMMGSATTPRHLYVMHHGVEQAYAAKTNPLKLSTPVVDAGKKLYEQDCASCHGAAGLGDGPAARSLTPPPPDIAATVHMPMASDGYLYWTIAEGGVPFHTAMPAFKASLSQRDIWEVIAYLRTL
jgi:mono/diheme cytochrome c family protein